MLGFTRAVRAAGVPVTVDRSQAFLHAAALVGVGDPGATYWAGRATLCASPDDLIRYEQVFESWFMAKEGLPRSVPRKQRAELVTAALPDDDGAAGTGADEDPEVVQALASATEVLRHRDIAELTGAQKAVLAAMFTSLHPTSPRRRAHRRTPHRRGQVDAGRTLRETLRRLGEPGPIARRRQGMRPRRVVLLIDVSGSMSNYADALLRLAHRYVGACGRRNAVEVFTTGTRLTRVTRALVHRDPERALIAAGEAVPDWAGGTRLGEGLKAFSDRWGQRGLARGAVVVIFSDGWERGDTSLLAEQMQRLHRMAHRVVWVNPHRGKAGYQPIQSGVLAALPHVDDFLAGHSLATFSELTEVIARA